MMLLTWNLFLEAIIAILAVICATKHIRIEWGEK